MPNLTRVAVRIILLDSASRVLLFEGRDLSDTEDVVRFWFTVGGGRDENETLRETAERELLEETGLSGFDLVGPFHRREFDFLNHGEPQHQIEHFFAARTARTNLTDSNWTDLERKAMTTWQWWSADDLETKDITYFPENLPDLMRQASTLV
ncbi:NUDIX hydrolase [Brevibacterium oceani]|uniref:NUDIX hydrolase n=1 Tax=Brevibacterium oceani TaxID=358099 RepID=UPI001B33A62E|nr:NUDIX domain-containing protein [Brevibacterium oceani]